MKFNEFKINEDLIKAIDKIGYEQASPIQEEAIPHLLEGRDVIARAQTGTGKTAAFAIPLIQKVKDFKDVQALVLVPTRELAIQVSKEIKKLAKFNKHIRVAAIYGGSDMRRQVKALKNDGINVVVGTPGRIMDHMRRKTLKLDWIDYLVLDEADEMFDMGFRDDMKTIIDETPADRQTCFFSATFANDIMDFSKTYQNDPVEVIIEAKELTVSDIKQYYLEMDRSMKTEILNRILAIYSPKLSIVFCNTKKMVDNLVSDLTHLGYNVDALHGDLKQGQRDHVMKKFRNNTIDILIATDIAARGIDVEDVDIVFNYDLPQQDDYYVHRIGRTARAGKKGLSFTFVTSRDYHKLPQIEKYTKSKMEKMDLPTIVDVKDSSNEDLEIKILEELKQNNDVHAYNNLLNEVLSKGYSLYDLALNLLKMVDDNENQFTSKELKNVDYGKKFEIDDSKSRSKNKRKRSSKIKGPKMFINKGARDGINADVMMQAVRKHTSLPASEIGHINIMPSFSFVEIKNLDYLNKAIAAMNGKKIKGKQVKVEYSNK